MVHVTAICAEGELHGLGAFFPDDMKTERREIVYRIEMANLLVGDLVEASVEQHAIRLLGGLVAVREHQTPVSEPDREQSHERSC